MKLLKKTPFVEFVATFLEIPFEIRNDILVAASDEVPYTSTNEKLFHIYEQVYDKSVDDDTWSGLFKELGVYQERFEF